MQRDPQQTESDGGPRGPVPLWSELHAAWGLSERASPGERAQVLAARLAERRFALDEPMLAGWPLIAAGDLRAAVRDAGRSWRDESLQQALATAVREFARQYFTLPPAERRARWVALRHAADFAPELLPRLSHLAAGLDVDAAALEDRDLRVQTLLAEVRTTYPLPAAERAARRAALAREKRKRSTEWATVAKEALRRLDAIPDLGRDYLSQLERAPARSKLIERQRRLAKHTSYVHSPPMGKGHFGVIVFFVMLMAAISRVTTPPRRSAQVQYPPISTQYRFSGEAPRSGLPPPYVPPPSYDPEQVRIMAALDKRGVAGVLPYRALADLQRWQPIVPAKVIPVDFQVGMRIFARFVREGYVAPEKVGVLETVGGIFVLLRDEDFDALETWLASHPHLNLKLLQSR